MCGRTNKVYQVYFSSYLVKKQIKENNNNLFFRNEHTPFVLIYLSLFPSFYSVKK